MKQKKIITTEQLKHIIKRFNINIQIGHCTILKDGLIDVDGSVQIANTSLRKLPLRFGKVNGDFYCHTNKLEKLVGAPHTVTGDFNCANNQLKSLTGAPKEIGGNFSCHENVLTSLKGSPRHVKGNFNAFLNLIETLDGAPDRIDGNCSLFENRLISLQSGPVYVGGSFHVTGNLLTNLIGLPEFIGNVLSIDDMISLYTGNKNCAVRSVKIEMKQRKHQKNRFLPPILIEHIKYLPIVFKYMKYISDLDIFSADGAFNQTNFEDIIFDIESGLR